MPSSDSVIYTDWPDALARLNDLLPLAARQAALEPPLRALHRRILASFARTGCAPVVRELAPPSAEAPVADALSQLRALDLLVLDTAGEIGGAYPYTSEQTAHRVGLGGAEVHAMCAVDALAIAPMAGRSTAIDSRCHHCGASVQFIQCDEAIDPREAARELHVGIAWRDTGGCAAHSLCREMVFFCNSAHAGAWQAGKATHAVMRLAPAITLAKAFFLPLLGERSE